MDVLNAKGTTAMVCVKQEPGSSHKESHLSDRLLTSSYKFSPSTSSSSRSSRDLTQSKLLSSLQSNGVVDLEDSTADENSESEEDDE